MNKLLYILAAILLLASCGESSERDYLRRGNRHYRAAMADTTAQSLPDTALLDKAVTEYNKAVAKDSLFARAYYNQGVALMYEGRDSLAYNEFLMAQKFEENPMRLARITHNMGVIMQSSKQFAQAIECYKESLRNNPKDDETRYNLALCQHQLKDEQNQDNSGGGGSGEGQDDKKDDQNGQDQNSQEQQSNDNKDQQNQQNQQNQQDQKQGQQEQQQPQQDQLSKEAAEQMLNAAMQNERATQDRLNRYQQRKQEQERNPGQRRLQKNW